jgi:hypothetical protein
MLESRQARTFETPQQGQPPWQTRGSHRPAALTRATLVVLRFSLTERGVQGMRVVAAALLAVWRTIPGAVGRPRCTVLMCCTMLQHAARRCGACACAVCNDGGTSRAHCGQTPIHIGNLQQHAHMQQRTALQRAALLQHVAPWRNLRVVYDCARPGTVLQHSAGSGATCCAVAQHVVYNYARSGHPVPRENVLRPDQHLHPTRQDYRNIRMRRLGIVGRCRWRWDVPAIQPLQSDGRSNDS